MIVLGIESTCDETACSIVKDGREILSNVVSSQIDLHKQYGGVVPELACRRHIDIIIPVIDEALKTANVTLQEIDLISVARGPGLIGALLIGLNAAKTLSLAMNKPFIGVNHIEAHLYATIMSQPEEIPFPCLGVVISGGHTSLVLIRSIGEYQLLGQTVDDAIGEAFDKVAKIMGLPYPGGPEIERLAKTGDPFRYPFKSGNVKGQPLNFSFSGLKTGVLYAIKGQMANQNSPLLISESDKNDVAASFQRAAFEDLILKSLKAADRYECRAMILGGGVSNNQRLREMFIEADPAIPIYWPAPELTLDNAAMIAGLGYHRYRMQGSGDHYDLEALTRIAF
jgi:N6-L-threonylcarbamoyladenine synthase